MGKSGKDTNRRRLFWQRDKNNASQTKDLLDRKENGIENGKVGNVSSDTGEFVPPDGGWGWVVCFASLWANGVVFGIINTFGIVYVQMREHYAKNDPEVSLKTAFVGSTCTGVTFLMCTVSSILSDRVGIRPTALTGAILSTIGLVSSAFIERLELLYLTYGLILGVGSSMVYSPSLVILGHYFKKHMGLVNGIVAFGSSIFTIALTQILPRLLEKLEIKYCFLFLSSLHFMMILFTLSWRPLFKKEDHLAALTMSTESVYEHCGNCCQWTKKFLNVKIWKNRAYVTWIVSLCVGLFGYFVPFFHLPKHTQDTFPESDGSILILCLSITSGVSRIICGKIADMPWVSRIRMQQLAFFILGVSTLCIPFSSSFWGLIVISLIMGICDGVFVCLLGPIAFDIVGPAEASQAIGFLLGIFSIPFTIGPPVAGWLYDTMGDYRVAFHVAGAPPILGAIMMFFIPKVQQSFPAVTETMEFASISMMDVYNEVRVPHEKRLERAANMNGAPSGPSTELEIITSDQLLSNIEKEKAIHTADYSNDEEAPMLKAEEAIDNRDDGEEQGNEEIDERNEPLESENYTKENHSESNHKEDIENNIDTNIDTETGNHTPDEKQNGDNIESKPDKSDKPTDTEDNGVPEPKIEIGIESSSLLKEVGKLLEVKHVSFDSEQKTAI